MAKTLVALYDICTDAERVVQALLTNGFAGSDIHLALDHTEGCETQHAAIEREVAYAGAHLVETLTDLGVPYEEAYAYTEGVRRGGALVVVESSDDQAERGMEILRRLRPVDIHERTAQWRQEGWTDTAASATTSTPMARTTTTTRSAQEQARAQRRGATQGAPTQRVEDTKEITIPVVEEEISIGTREVERGHVRIYSRVIERPVEETVRLREETVTVERRPVDRPATDADFAAAGKDVIEMTETAEEAVVSKRARVVEEVVVQKEATERTETVRGIARHTDVDVQREPETATATRPMTPPHDFATYHADFREHYSTAFGHQGAAYTEYEPAYRYGYELGTNERYRGQDWAALEAEARRDWEARYPYTWDRFKDAIRHGWESLTGHGTARPRDARTVDRTDFTAYSDDFHTHYVATFGDKGTVYSDYEPAYHYGYELGTNARYRGRDWSVLEADARREWEAQHPTTWERFKDAIHYGWDKVRART
ncbi:MAG TPA: YsnF/AvaK domain-containing protein [Candidatus Tectomicrobia bacterium]